MSRLQQAAALAHDHYGLSVSATPLAGELDLNFKLLAQDGTCYVMKLHRSSTDLQVLEMQNAVLSRLENQASNSNAPRLIRTTGGLNQIQVAVDGRAYIMRLLTWLESE